MLNTVLPVLIFGVVMYFPFALLAICAYAERLIFVRVKRRTFPWPSLLLIPAASGFILWRFTLISPTSLDLLVGWGGLCSIAALVGSVIGAFGVEGKR